MAAVANGVHQSINDCTVYAANDFLLGPVLLFIHINPTGSITSHILTIVGYKHYRNFVANYTIPEYKAAVTHLPSARQGSEVFRGMAMTLVKYFNELTPKLRQTVHEYHIQNEKNNGNKYDNWSVLPVAFESEHAAKLAARMFPVEEPKKLVRDFELALTARYLNWLDVDIVVRGGIFKNEESFPAQIKRLVNLFGEPTGLSSAKLQRPQSSFLHSRHKSFVQNADPAALEREVQELVATERNYVARMSRLMEEIVMPMRKSARDLSFGGDFPTESELSQLFPSCLDEIVQANSVFADEVDNALEQNGILGVAKVCLQYFPSFKRCYQEYLRASPKFTQLFSQFAKKKGDLFYKSVEVVGEQQLKSWLIDPVQRLPRYTLYIDNMLNHVEIAGEVFNTLNQARDVISEICSLQKSDSDERSQTIHRLQGIIPSWPLDLKPKGRLITAVDCYEVLPPYNNDSSESLASILLLFPDCIVILRRPTSTSLLARGILAEVDRPSSMKISTASKKDGIDLAFAGWCDLQDTRFAEADYGETIWLEHIVDLNDNWTKGGEAGYRKLALYNAYERKASKFTEEVAQARLERRCANDPKGLVGIRRKDTEMAYNSMLSSLWGNEFDGYRQSPWKSRWVIFLGEQSGSLQGSLKAELEDGYEVVAGVEPVSAREVKFEFHAVGVQRSRVVKDDEFWDYFSTTFRECFVEMNPMEADGGLRSLCVLSTNERLLRSFKVSYDGYATSRLTRRLRPGSPAKILSSVFGTGQPGSGNSSPTKSAKPVLVIDQRTKLPPPRGGRSASGEAAQQKITLVKDDQENIAQTGLNMFMRLEKTVELYMNGLRGVLEGCGFNLMVTPDATQSLSGVSYEKQFEAHKLYMGFVDFLRGEWTEKIGTFVGRRVLDTLYSLYDQYGRQDSWAEFQEVFSDVLSDMTPQNRRTFKNVMVMCYDLTFDLPENHKAMLVPSFVNLLHLDDEDVDPESPGNINFDLEYVRMVFFIALHSDTFFDETPKSHETSVENSPVKVGGVRRAQTVAAASQAIKKKFTHLGGSIRGDAHRLRIDSEGPVNRMASVLKNFSKRDKTRLHASRSVDEVIGGTDTIRPIRPTSSDRPLLATAFHSPSKESITPTLETILASPVDDTRGLMGPPSTRPRRKRRSSLSDLKPDENTVTLLDRNSVIYDRVPVRPAAPAPLDITKAPAPLRTGSKSGVRTSTPPGPSESPTPHVDRREMNVQRERSITDRKENISRKPVPRSPVKPSSNQALRPTGSSQLRERISVERNIPTESDIALQREIREMNRIGEELQGAARSKGATSTAPSSVASSTSSAYATSHPTSAASSSYSYTTDDYRRLHTRGSSSEINEYRSEIHHKEERIKDLVAEIARKDMEVQAQRSELRRKEQEIVQRDHAYRDKLERMEQEFAKREAEFRRREESHKLEMRKRDEELAVKRAESAKQAEEHKAELRKRDRAMRNLNKLYADINAEQEELYNRCNDEIENIARSTAAMYSGQGGNPHGDLYRSLQEAYTKEGAMRQEITTLRRQVAKFKAKIEES